MKKSFFILCFLSLLIGVFLPFLTNQVLAADSTTTLQYPIGDLKTASSPGEYVTGLFNIALGIAGVLAVGMIVAGGFLYMVGGVSPAQTGKAREMITGAILGLLLLLATALILQTIDPDLLELKINLPSSSSSSSSGGSSGSNSSGSTNKTAEGTSGDNSLPSSSSNATLDQQTALSQLSQQSNLSINPCTGSSTSGCAGLSGVKSSTVDGLIEIAQACSSCKITVTSVTEGEHSTKGTESHANGYKADTSARDAGTNAFFESLPQTGTRSDGAALYTYETACCTVTVADERNLANVSAHWDLKFSPKSSAYKS